MDLVTTYRCLAKFVEAGVLVTCDFGAVGDRTVRYELAPVALSHHHHHIICTACHRVDPVRSCSLGAQNKELQRLGYKGISHKLEFFGICAGCAKKPSGRTSV
jgi:Fur family ferric uptake transcriptional regulator